MSFTQQIEVNEASQIGHARRLAVSLADNVGFDATARGQVALVVTELATNLIRHAGGGSLLISRVLDDTLLGLEIQAVDKGMGIQDLARCLTDGYSTAGTPGNGLGAVRRASADFAVFSQDNKGAAVFTRLWPHSHIPTPKVDAVGAVSVPYPGETVNGDSWAADVTSSRRLLMVADGLGHGILASTAALEAVRAFDAARHLGLDRILQSIHEALRSTRGAAVSIGEIDTSRKMVRFVGIGNVSGCLLTPDNRSKFMVSINGIVGHEIRKIQIFEYPWDPNAALVLHSDGLSTSWRMDAYPGLLSKPAGLIAGVLYRDFKRGRDDATVAVLKDLPDA